MLQYSKREGVLSVKIPRKVQKMPARLPYLLLPAVTLILEILPWGAVCNFAAPAEDGTILRYRKLYSYFDLLPFGYANFTPLITAIITCVITLLLIVYCVSGKKALAAGVRNLLWVCAVISLGPLAYGLRYFSAVGALITLSLMGEALLLHRGISKE